MFVHVNCNRHIYLACTLFHRGDERDLIDVANDMAKSYIWVLCAIGIPGNVFIIIIIAAMRMLSPATFFITLLAVCDGVALISKLIGSLIVNNDLCKLDFFPNYFSSLANWALVMICFERFVCVFL